MAKKTFILCGTSLQSYDQVLVTGDHKLGHARLEEILDSLRLGMTIKVGESDAVQPSIGILEPESRTSKSPPSTQELIDKFLAAKRAANRSEVTVKTYKDTLRPFARAYPVLPTKPEQIEEYLVPHRGENSTAKDIYIVLSIFYKFASTRFGVPNPVAQVDKPQSKKKTPDHLTIAQARALLSAIETERERGLIYCLFGLGLRLAETRRLKVVDIGEDTIQIHGKERDEPVPLLAEIRDTLAKLTEGKDPGGDVFQGRQGPLSDSQVQNIVKRLFDRAGIKGVRSSPHTLRHSKGALSTILGLDSFSNRRLLRHTSTQMTDRYSELNLNELRAKDLQYNPLLRLLAEPELGIKPDYAQLDPSELLPQFLDQMIALGQMAQELKHSLGGNGHRAEQIEEIRQYLQCQASK